MDRGTFNGPYDYDYFWVIVDRNMARYEIPYAAIGSKDARKILGDRFACHLESRLAGCADFNSRIFWPRSLAENDLLVFEKYEMKGLDHIVRFWRRYLVNVKLTEEVCRYIETCAETPRPH